MCSSKLKLPFDSEEAQAISKRIAEEIFFAAYSTSNELAKELGQHPNFHETKAAKGVLHVDHWDTDLNDPERWETLRENIKQDGLRNSLIIAIAPTATIASITGCYEVSNHKYPICSNVKPCLEISCKSTITWCTI